MAKKNTVNSTWNAYQDNENNKPKSFTYSQSKPTFDYDDSALRGYYDRLMNRKDFSFDLDSNALYNQYKDKFVKQGQLAMMDTIGQASAMTGGYGNSYAASAGQQAYQQNLDSLNDIVPELYQLAMEQYQMEGQNLMDMYGVASNERDVAYGKYRDEVSDYNADRDFAYGQHRDAVADYQADRDYLYGVYSDTRDFAYQKERDAVADKQWSKEYKLSEREFEEACKQFALQHDLDVKQFNVTQASKGRSGSGSGGGAGSGGGGTGTTGSTVTSLTADETATVEAICNDIMNLGIADNDSAIKKYLNGLMEDNGIGLKLYDVIKNELGIA